MNDDLVSPILLLLFFFLQQITFLWQNTKKVLSFPLRFCTLIMLNILMSDSNVISKTKQSLPSRGMETSTQIWMKQKAARDIQLWQNDQHLWIVQNKLYDLSSYVDSHPGGGHWLAYTKGQDITSHFITHHLNQDKARAVLQKYFVGQAKKKQEPVFTFQHQGLFRKVKRRILEKYSPAELQDTSKSFINGCVFLVLWILSFLAMAHQRSYLLAILCSTLMFPIIGVAHNFIHMKNHPFRFLFLITGFTHVEWQIMHCISHHAYANTLVDYQIQALEPVIYYLKTSPENKKINWLIKQLVLPLGPLLNILLRTIITPLTKRMLPDFLFLTPLIQIPLIYLITNDLILSLKLFTTMHVVFGFLFLKLTFLGHRTGAEWTAGNVEIRDFAEHQIYASSDTPTNNCRGFWSYLLYAGFNFHAIHHIFPTIDNHSLPEASNLFEQQASKMGIRLNKLKNVFSGLIQIEKNFFKRKVWKKE